MCSIYHDLVHDFEFLKFDFMMIKHMQIAKLKFQSEFTHVSVKIQVVSNDAEKILSIFSEIISCLNQNVSEYKREYNDFNINYIQTAVSASSKSLESSVIDINDNAVVILTDDHVSDVVTNYFLFMNHSFQVLKCICNSKLITYNTIQTK